MSRYLSRLGRFSFRHRRVVLAAWLLVLGAMVGLAGATGGKTSDTFTVPGTQSQQAVDLIHQRIPALAGASTQIIVATSPGAKVTDRAVTNGIDATVTRLEKVPQVAAVTNPFQTKTISPNGRAAIITVQYNAQAAGVKTSTLNALTAATGSARATGAEVQYSGVVYPGSTITASETPEAVGILIGFVILLITFGSLVAAGLPLLTAIIGVGIGLTGITALAKVVTVSSASTALALMLGLSCGIDYALFIASRHRANMLRGMSVEDSVALAVGTAGSSVVFAALTVMVALCGLTVVGIPFLSVMGLAAAGTVAIALLIAITLLPALFGFAGIAGALTKYNQFSGPLLAALLVFPTLGMAAAPVNSWAARRAALPAWLRDRRRTEYRRDRRAFAAGMATGGAIAVVGVAIAAAALLFTGHQVQTPNLVGPVQGSSAPAAPATPSRSPSSSPSASTSPTSSPSATPTPTPTSSSPSPSTSPSPSSSPSPTASPTPTATSTATP